MIDLLPDDIVREVFGFVLGGQPACFPALSLTCKRWHKLVTTYDHTHTIQAYANMAAAEGYVSLLSCYHVWAPQLSANPLLCAAAGGGHPECMQLAQAWGATTYDGALATAASYGHPKCMQLAKAWGATAYNLALANAAANGHPKCMQLAKGWGAAVYNWALARAAQGGHP